MNLTLRPLEERDLDAADRIMRLAFGTFIGVPEPETFVDDVDYVRTRWRADGEAAFAAEYEGELVGSNFATCWGSVGFFGPLTIHPAYWDRGIGAALVRPALELMERRGVRHAGLYTFAASPKHVGLYSKLGFWPRYLTAITARPVEGTRSPAGGVRYSALTHEKRAAALEDFRELTGAVHPGLDVTSEVRSVHVQDLGETVLLREGGQLLGAAVCHVGAGSEAGSDTCFVKFAAARPGSRAEDAFARMLGCVEDLAAEAGCESVRAGVNLARTRTARLLRARGYRTEMQGVAMHRPDEPAYSHPEAFVIDDWR